MISIFAMTMIMLQEIAMPGLSVVTTSSNDPKSSFAYPSTNASTSETSFESRSASPSTSPSTSPFAKNGDICSYFQMQPFTATRFWQDHLSQIMTASKNPLIPELMTEEEDTKLHKLLEQVLTPARFRRGVRHMPTFSNGQASVKRVIQIIENRIRDPENHPPLKIAVFGGSVTIGRMCRLGKGMTDFDCAWPMRFQLLINQFAKQYTIQTRRDRQHDHNDHDNNEHQKDADADADDLEIVKVYNMGVGGTGNEIGTNMVKFWMYRTAEISKTGPDIIINSYSTNESYVSKTLVDLGVDLVTAVMDKARYGLQNFVRAALTSKRGCGEVPPLVVLVDDYLGPMQDALLGELSYNTAMTQLAKWYDTVAVSYGDVVRDLAWFEGDETFYSKDDVHYGHWAHQTIAWSLGFASLELLSNYCDDEYVKRKQEIIMNQGTTLLTDDSDHEGPSMEIHEIGDEGIKKKNNYLFLPPPLTRDLMLKNAEADFNAALESAYKSNANMNCSSTSIGNNTSTEIANIDKNPCIVAWISTPDGYGANDISIFMKYNTWRSGRPIDGWQVEKQSSEGWKNKVGWVANRLNATFSLQFDNIAKDVNTVTIFFLRSYGEKWKDSRAKFAISHENSRTGNGDGRIVSGAPDTSRIVSEGEIEGFHNTTSSLTTLQEFQLSDTIRKGESMSVKVDVVSGSTFKIMGIMICT